MNDGKTLFSAGLDGFIFKIDLNNFSSLRLEGNVGPIRSLTNPLNGLTIFSACENKIVEWDIINNKIIKSYLAHDLDITDLLYLQDRDIIVSGGKDKLIKIWNPITNECLGSLEGHLDSIKCITYGIIKDHINIVSVGKDSVITFWDLDDKDLTRSFKMRSTAKQIFYLFYKINQF